MRQQRPWSRPREQPERDGARDGEGVERQIDEGADRHALAQMSAALQGAQERARDVGTAAVRRVSHDAMIAQLVLASRARAAGVERGEEAGGSAGGPLEAHRIAGRHRGHQ